ncbi:MAG: DUF502 domain-containing protein [Candidatus Aureabacteria bacterium]|nr:DUF502 domain-containing protein [Candidatus Auribacterota bacterium]
MENKNKEKKGFWASIAIKKNIITGLFMVMPIVLSISVFVFLFNFFVNIFRVDQITEILLKRFSLEEADIEHLKIYLIVFVILVIISSIYLIGLFARYLFMRKILSLLEVVLFRIPIFNKIYIALKQISNAVWGNKATIFRRVVLLEYPRKGLFTMAFLTFKTKGEILQKAGGENVCNVFVPTTPNPTSGFLIMVAEKDIQYLDMSVEDGMKLIISGGAVIPRIMNESKNNNDIDGEGQIDAKEVGTE